MKHYFIIFILIVGYTVQSQVPNFNKAKLTKRNGNIEEVFYKKRQYIIDNKGSLNIYSAPSNSSKLIITPNDFSKIESDDKNIMIVSALVKGIDKNKFVVLRRLVDGDKSLYKHINDLGESTFVNKSSSNYSMLSKNIENKGGKYYKKWLFEHFNPQNKSIASYGSLKYIQNDFISYYLSNQANSTLLPQEQKVKTFNLSIYSGVLFNKISGDPFDLEQASSTNFKIGVQASVTLDPVQNNHSLFGGITYYTSMSGAGSFIDNPESTVLAQRRNISTEVELNWMSVQLGYQYNFNMNKISISPFFAFEPMFYLSNNSLEAMSQEDQSQVFITGVFTGTPKSFNIGLKISSQQKIFIMLEYNSIIDIVALQPGFSGSPIRNNMNISSFSLSLGYTIF